MLKALYPRARRYSRDTIIYGFCRRVDRPGGYFFNRRYVVLPVATSPALFAALMPYVCRVSSDRHGHGDHAPKAGVGLWETCWLFDDATAPRWSK